MTLWGMRESVTKCHKGEGSRRGQPKPRSMAKVSRDIMNNINLYFGLLFGKMIIVWKIKMSRHAGAGDPGGGGRSAPVSSNDTWGGGLK